MSFERQQELLRCDNCGEGFPWPVSEFDPQYCPICGKKQPALLGLCGGVEGHAPVPLEDADA